jgi:hypothetical protein
MRELEHQSGPAGLKTPIKKAIAAIIGLVVGVISLLLFVFDLLVAPEVDALIVSFMVCGMGLTTGLILLRSLIPRSEPQSLFGASGGIPVQPMARVDIAAVTGACPPHRSRSAIAISGESETVTIGHNDRHQSISRYTTPEGGGLIGLTAMLGMAIILMAGSNFARQFLSLAIPAGGAVALVLYLARRGRLD